MSILANLSEGFRSGVRRAGDLSIRYSRIGRIRFEIVAIKKEVEELLIEVGGRVYDMAVRGNDISIRADKELQQKIERIKELETELTELKIRLKQKEECKQKS